MMCPDTSSRPYSPVEKCHPVTQFDRRALQGLVRLRQVGVEDAREQVVYADALGLGLCPQTLAH